MKILSIQPAARRGGPSVQHLNFIRESTSQGCEHHTIVREDHEMLDDYRHACTSVTTYSPLNSVIPRSLSPSRLTSYFRDSKQLAHLVALTAKQNQVDVMWTFNDALLAGPLGARRAKIPSVSHFIGMTSYQPKPVGYALMGFHRRYSDRLICCQDITAADLARLGYPANRIDVVYHGIDAQKFNAPHPSVTKNLESVHVGMIANLDRRKGHKIFIEAAALVSAKHPETRFTIAGDLPESDYLDEIKTLISANSLHDNLNLPGSIKNIPNWLQTLDIACVPSLMESFSVACLEAMASSLPVVATSVGGNVIAVQNDVTGYLARANDPEDFAEKIIQLVQDSAKREKFGRAAASIVKERYSIEQTSKKLIEAFQRAKSDYR